MSTIEERIARQKKEAMDATLVEMTKKGNDYFNLIVVAPISEIKKLPESTFVKHFLPYFCGESPITEEVKTLGLWIGIAGSITSKVDIVNGSNEVLFTVPAINDTSIFDVTNNKGSQSFKNIVLNYKLYSNQTPMSGQNYLSRTIDQRLDALRTQSGVFSENEAAWQKIFERYGKIKLAEIQTVQKKNSLDDDEFIYD